MAITRNVTQDDRFYLGEDKIYRVTIAGEDLAGMAFRFLLKRNKDDGDSAALIDKSTDDDITLLASGIMDIRFRPADTNKSKPRITADDVYWYSIRRNDPDNVTITTEGTWQFLSATQR